MEHQPYTWASALAAAVPSFGLDSVPEHTVTSIFVALLLVVLALTVRQQLARPEDAVVPGERATIALVAQYFVEGISSIAEGVIGHGSARYVPWLGGFFLFILVANLLGLVPGFIPPTGDTNVTFALGTVAFLLYNYYGIREHGVRYVKQFLGPVAWLVVIMLPIELISHLFRPFSLGVRLGANMFADHQVIEKFTELVPLLLPVPFYALGAFVCVVQAFVFTLLTAIYISLAVSHEH